MSLKSTFISETVIKFFAPATLKDELQALADERGLSLSALMRLIATEYIKTKR